MILKWRYKTRLDEILNEFHKICDSKPTPICIMSVSQPPFITEKYFIITSLSFQISTYSSIHNCLLQWLFIRERQEKHIFPWPVLQVHIILIYTLCTVTVSGQLCFWTYQQSVIGILIQLPSSQLLKWKKMGCVIDRKTEEKQTESIHNQFSLNLLLSLTVNLFAHTFSDKGSSQRI